MRFTDPYIHSEIHLCKQNYAKLINYLFPLQGNHHVRMVSKKNDETINKLIAPGFPVHMVRESMFHMGFAIKITNDP